MATLIPSLGSAHFDTRGELRLAERLKDCLEDNSYIWHNLPMGPRGRHPDFVIVHLTFCPSSDAVAWAKSIFDTYPNRIGIVTTHGYLNEFAQRTVHICGSTQYLWDSLGAITSNLRFMLSAHVSGESSRIDTVGSRTVFQLMADFQSRSSGGEGWLIAADPRAPPADVAGARRS